MQYNKATLEGRNERLCVLERFELGVRSLLCEAMSKTIRKYVQADDILDASVAFVTAEAIQGNLASLVGEPSHDTAGLPMEMVYLKI